MTLFIEYHTQHLQQSTTIQSILIKIQKQIQIIMSTTYSNAFLMALFVVGSDENTDLNGMNAMTIIEPNSNRFSPIKNRFYTKQIKSKQVNSRMRAQHRISQPQWRGYSH